MRDHPVTCSTCGARVVYPSIRCSQCGTRIPCPMGFLSYLMAVLWVLPALSLIAIYFFSAPSLHLYLCVALFFPALALTWLLATDKRKARRDAQAEDPDAGEPQ